jgi:hypothetical protein
VHVLRAAVEASVAAQQRSTASRRHVQVSHERCGWQASMRRLRERLRQRDLRILRRKGRHREQESLESVIESFANAPGWEEYSTHSPGLEAKKALYPLPAGFPHKVASTKSLEHRILRLYRNKAGARARKTVAR